MNEPLLPKFEGGDTIGEVQRRPTVAEEYFKRLRPQMDKLIAKLEKGE